MITIAVALLDFIIYYLSFIYQRATLKIARNQNPEGSTQEISRIQSNYTPTWLGLIGWLNWITFFAALYLLWHLTWWYAPLYGLIRLIGAGLLPTFEDLNSKRILARYHK